MLPAPPGAVSEAIPGMGSKCRATLTDTLLPFAASTSQELSHNSRRFRFALPNPTDTLGLPIGKHINLSFVDAVCFPGFRIVSLSS